MKNLPIWVTLLLNRMPTPAEVSELPIPQGFLAWAEEGTLADLVLDPSASEDPPGPAVARLHLSGGTNEMEFDSHAQPAAIRNLGKNLAAVTTPPGEETRIISGAGLKVERLTAVIRRLCALPFAVGVVFPQSNSMAFSAREFVSMSDDFTVGSYHFPLYVYTKVRDEADGPYAATGGLFVFGLPDIAIPLSPSLSPQLATQAMGQLQREMVAEGWYPEHGATWTTDAGVLAIERVGHHGLFVVPQGMAFDAEKVANARTRFTLERASTNPYLPQTRYRVRAPGLVCDHLLGPAESLAMTVGLSQIPQRGGTPAGENDRLELMIETAHLGPWATGWLAWLASAVRDNDGRNPLKPFDRVVAEAPENDIAGVILWPRGPWQILGTTIHVWSLVPILSAELAQFRAQPGSQQLWLESNARNVPALLDRWSRVAR